MRPSARNAYLALRSRLSSPRLWVTALGAGILLLAIFVLINHRLRFQEACLWLLVTPLVVFLAPMPWQWCENPSVLNNWNRALPFSLLMGATLALLVTVKLLLWLQPPNGFLMELKRQLPAALLVLPSIFVIFGWPLAHAELLYEKTCAFQAKAESLDWMRNRTPFAPELLITHLRHLATQAEQAPEKTVEGILLLAQMYRQWLSMSEFPLVPLSSERKLLECFIDAEQHRLGEQVDAVWEWTPSAGAQRLPPFTLFPLLTVLLEGGARTMKFQARKDANGFELKLESSPESMEDLSRHMARQEALARLRKVFGEGVRLDFDAPGLLVLRLS